MPRIGTFIAGGVIGAVAALLVAPRPGRETRAMVADMASEVFGDAQDWSGQVAESAQNVYQRTTDRGQDVLDNVQEKVDNVRPMVTERNNDLRERIDAARQRIAAQVAKNTNEDSFIADDVAAAAAEVDEEFTDVEDFSADAADAADAAADAVE